MLIHIFQHVPFEGPGCITDWANTHHHTVTFTKWYAHPAQPDLAAVDLLVIMGGPMEHGMDELVPATYVQDADTIRSEQQYIEGSNITMYRLLDFLVSNYA